MRDPEDEGNYTLKENIILTVIVLLITATALTPLTVIGIMMFIDYLKTCF